MIPNCVLNEFSMWKKIMSYQIEFKILMALKRLIDLMCEVMWNIKLGIMKDDR